MKDAPGRGSDGRSRGPWDHPEQGSATALAVGVVAGLVTMLLTGLVLVSVLVAGQQARTAADLAALAGMGRIVEGGDRRTACAAARQVATDNGAVLDDCNLIVPASDPWGQVRITTRRDVAGTPWSATAVAVAGGVATTQRP